MEQQLQPHNPEQPQPQNHHLPVPFQHEGRYWKIVPDRSFFPRMIAIGINEFMAAARALVGHDCVIASSWCMDFEVIKHLAGVSNIPREHLTCLEKESCETDTGCISNLVGEFNSENLIVATQENMAQYGRVARLPVMTFNSNGVLVFWQPSHYQEAFSILPRQTRRERVLEEASKVFKRVKKVKQSKRKFWH